MCSSTVPNEEPAHLSGAAQACQYQAWHQLLRTYALRSVIIPLPAAFLDYLLSDGVYLGQESQALPKAPLRSDDSDEEEVAAEAEQEGQEEEGSDGWSSVAEQEDWTTLFPELNKQISDAIDKLDGKVVPKLNWSCPMDAVWVNPGSTLACENAEQVVLMLKSSDRVVHDLELLQSLGHHATAHPASTSASTPDVASTSDAPASTPHPSATLALRKWYDLRPEREWRCFVRNRQLVGICQRDPTQHFPQVCGSGTLVEEEPSEARPAPAASTTASPGATTEVTEVAAGPVAHQARALLTRFHQDHVQDRFPLDHYTYDAYVSTINTVKLIDFNPVGGTTSPLLFSWESLGLEAVAEAEAAGNSSVQPAVSSQPDPAATIPESVKLRVVPAAGYVHPGHRAACGMPFDMLGLRETVENMVSKMQDDEAAQSV